MAIIDQLNQCRQFFETGATKSYTFRMGQLKKLKAAIEKYETEIYSALYADLKKSAEECWVTENGLVLAELNMQIKHLKEWMATQRKPTNLLNLPSSSYVYKEPLGVVLIIAPWNYPFQLLMNPVIGAMAAGNCVVVKPSEFAPATAAVIKKIITQTFDSNYILFTEGDGAAVVPQMMNNFTFDHVFFTGSTGVGKSIYKMAAENLVPVTLELGGKSPCVVEADANLKVAAKRIAMTKFSNAGQMCVAPDYVLVHSSVKEKLIFELKDALQQFFGKDALASDYFGKIINEKQFDRLANLLSDAHIVYGGKHDKTKLYIEPTIITNVDATSLMMQEEIFGPLLPIISFDTKQEALNIIATHKNPLAFYVFTSSTEKEKEWIDKVAFGGGCINNASWHLTNHNLPFGGRGNSGIGRYHGKYSFDTFSHTKAVLKTPTWFDPAIKYPPFKGKLKLFKWIIR
ncbi:MAG TPA: aldehyde dehydrogenase [Ferruginibacter sp.]|nr:aldehyde dehydrogenase [Ferruginibacter sp.]HRE64145.1 aldehyde dehydrogenase [Ferruginibacter sp.]